MGLSISELISQSSGIYALPEMYLQLNRKLQDPIASNTQIADIVQMDAGLASSLLKIVNSAFYGFPSSITSISQAITIIGRTELAELVLSKSVMDIFNKLDIENKVLEKHWHHSLLCALTAKQLAKSINHCEQSPDSLFVAGLLHDIGRLLIWHQLPEQSRKIVELSDDSVTNSTSIEKDILGFDHSAAGAALLENWKLPQLLIMTTGFHHKAAEATDFKQACQIIALANLACQLQVNEQNFEWLIQISSSASLNINLDALTLAMDIAQQQHAELGAIFLA